ncbi:MAG: N-acetyltransferase family protein [Deltaproteobacteria bacterium]|nr:N-acetyltransferase family protein [Deltaproteobacteria bacterium]
MNRRVSHLGLSIQPLLASDWPAVRRIFEAGLATGVASLETEVPAWEAWDAAHLAAGRLVARVGAEVVGWTALSAVSARRVYAGVAEVSLYVDPGFQGRGVGRSLLQMLVDESERLGLWTLQSAILDENLASAALHEAVGFRRVGRRERLGRRLGVWRDVLLYERRSPAVGG